LITLHNTNTTLRSLNAIKRIDATPVMSAAGVSDEAHETQYYRIVAQTGSSSRARASVGGGGRRDGHRTTQRTSLTSTANQLKSSMGERGSGEERYGAPDTSDQRGGGRRTDYLRGICLIPRMREKHAFLRLTTARV
jgi:hypothetical protein